MSNSIVQNQFNVLKETMALRDQLMEIVSDGDLAYNPGGDAKSLGVLCREMGEVEYGYIQSFKDFKLDFAYRYPDATIANSVSGLKAWFAELDTELLTTLENLSEETIQNQHIDRGGWSLPVTVQLHVYREGLLIFAGKVSIYLQLLQKTFPEQWQSWIG